MEQFWCWTYRNYILVLVLFLFLYVFGAILAPIFMHSGLEIPAKLLYGFYSTTCHQFAYRSWFLFGEQAYYPRSIAGVPGYQTYQASTSLDPQDQFAAREFLGNEDLGHKTALCQRDIAIYSALMLVGVFFILSQRKTQPISILLWVLIGMVPIAIDGFTQFGGSGFPILTMLPLRESNPFFRTMTGFLFGFTSGMYLFPKLEYTFGLLRDNSNCKDV